VIGIAASLVGGAASAADNVILVRDSAAVSGCERLGEVHGKSWLGGMMTNVAYGRALENMKDRARSLGATHLLVFDVSSGMAGSSALGEAYRCASAAEHASPASPPDRAPSQ
jgi:hypothetical protein